jgi:hypothetical protein
MSSWRISAYDVRLEGAPLELPPGPPRFVYVRDGQARMANAELPVDTGRFLASGTRVSGAGTLWLFEAGQDLPFLAAQGVSLVLSRPLALGPGPRLLRADRIESTSGSETPKHFHRGPGIRRVLFGSILGEIAAAWDRFDAGRAWFESGTEPVIGRNVFAGNSAFIRFLVLPPELSGGQTSFVAADLAEAAKPRAVQITVIEEAILP